MRVIRGDARRLPLRPKSAQICVSSPPYPRQRRYGDSSSEFGLEGTLTEYVDDLADVFDQLRGSDGILADDGVLWLNLGDRANFSGGAGGDWSRKQKKGGPLPFRDPSYPKQSYVDAPGAVVRELVRRGWRLRLPIVWSKGSEQPEDLNHVRRPRRSHEMIFMLAPSPKRTKFFPDRLAETGSVWTFPPGGSGDPHLAPFPDELARRCILPSTERGDVVMDPFAGSCTSERVATELGRVGVSVDLYAGIRAGVTPEEGAA